MEPFRLDVPESQLDDLRARLRATRWPEPATVGDWSQGVPLEYLRELCDYWATGYDWRRVEGWLNGLPRSGRWSTGSASTCCTSARRTTTRSRWC